MFDLKKILLVLLLLYLNSCHRSDLKITIINLSENKVYIGGVSFDCDSCEIKQDVRFYCSGTNGNPPMLNIVKVKDSVHLVDKLIRDTIKTYVINADSLDRFCANGTTSNILNKPWVRIFITPVNLERKTCTIVIK